MDNGLKSRMMKAFLNIATITITASLLLVSCNPNSGPAKIGEVKVFPKISGGEHTKTQDEVVTYDTLPPVGGKHSGNWQSCKRSVEQGKNKERLAA